MSMNFEKTHKLNFRPINPRRDAYAGIFFFRVGGGRVSNNAGNTIGSLFSVAQKYLIVGCLS